ncbi:TPA: hypothetical protein NK775_001749 [Serratia marcescens]|nr:hypothetical protein [Serratia marcescens]
MDNKLSELSKPVAWVKADRNIAENWSCTDPEAVISTEGWHSDYDPPYSQEYVSALLARIAELEAGHQEEAKQIASWRRIAKQNIEEREKDLAALDAERQKITGLEAKLATPVRLPVVLMGYQSDDYRIGFMEGVEKSGDEVRAAGFTVEGDE